MPSHTWNGESPPHTVHDIYDYIDRELRTLKTKLITRVEKQFFGGIEPIQFLIHMEEIFKSKHRIRKVKTQTPQISGLAELELFSSACYEVSRPGGARDARFTKDIQAFKSTFQYTIKSLSDLFDELTDLYCIVQTFCRNYQSLEGEFNLKWAREANLELKSTMQSIQALLENAEKGVNVKLFSSEKFSLEVAETCDTTRYPVLRLFPDLFQKFHFSFHLIGKWRANDQIYLEDIQFKLIKRKRVQRLKHEEYDTLELEHASLLSIIVEKRVRVKCREIRDRIKNLDQEITKLARLKRRMMAEKSQTESEIQERRSFLFMDKNVTDITKDLDDVLGVKKDIEILTRKLKSLKKSLKLNAHDLTAKETEKMDLDADYEEMRKLVRRSNQLASERTTLSKEISIINEKIQELEAIFYRKTDRNKLAQTYEDLRNTKNGVPGPAGDKGDVRKAPP